MKGFCLLSGFLAAQTYTHKINQPCLSYLSQEELVAIMQRNVSTKTKPNDKTQHLVQMRQEKSAGKTSGISFIT